MFMMISNFIHAYNFDLLIHYFSLLAVANPISVINIFRSNNSIKVQIMQSINASQLSPIVSATCDSDPTPMNMTVGSTPMVLIIMLPSACMFTVELLSENGMVIGFPIRGDINNDCMLCKK